MTRRATRAFSRAPAHITQGSSVTYAVTSSMRQRPLALAARATPRSRRALWRRSRLRAGSHRWRSRLRRPRAHSPRARHRASAARCAAPSASRMKPSSSMAEKRRTRRMTKGSPKARAVDCVDGGVRERPNRAVSKTAVSTGTVGSNPTSSANAKRVTLVTCFAVPRGVGGPRRYAGIVRHRSDVLRRESWSRHFNPQSAPSARSSRICPGPSRKPFTSVARPS